MCEQTRKNSLQKRFKSGTVSCQSCQLRLEDLMLRCTWKEVKAWSRTSYKTNYAACPATLPLPTPRLRMNVSKHNMELRVWVTVKERD